MLNMELDHSKTVAADWMLVAVQRSVLRAASV